MGVGRRLSKRIVGRGPPQNGGGGDGGPRRGARCQQHSGGWGVTGPGDRVAPLDHEGGWVGAGYGLREELKVLVQSRWYRRGRGKAGPGGRRTKWRRLMAACPPLPPPPLPGAPPPPPLPPPPPPLLSWKRAKALGSSRLTWPGVRGSGTGPKGSPGWDGGGAGADGGRWRRVQLRRCPSFLRGRAPTNGPSGQPPPPGVPTTSRLPPRLDTPHYLHIGRSALYPIPL